MPCLMHHAERVIAIADVTHEHAQRDEVVDLVERFSLGGVALHLLVRRVEVLDAPRHVGLDAGHGERFAQLPLDAPHEPFALRAPRGDRRGCPAVLLGFEQAEREVLELPLHLPDAEPAGERRVDVHRLARDLALPVRFEVFDGAHVVQPVGDLHDHDPHVLGHREQHLAHGLGVDGALAAGRCRRGDVVDLRRALDESGDVGAEAADQLLTADVAVLHDVVEQRRLHGVGVHVQLADEFGDGHGMRDVGLAGATQLLAVALGGELVRVADFFEAVVGEVPAQRFKQLRGAVVVGRAGAFVHAGRRHDQAG